MSEIRRVNVKMNNEKVVKEACKSAGFEVVENKSNNKIMIRNHGISTWNNREVSLVKKSDGNYVLEGDCKQEELEKLACKLRAFYAEKILVAETAKCSYNVVERVVEKDKIRIKLRAYV